MSPESFYGDGERCYATAWAFVRFLEQKHKARFERLMTLLRGGTIPEVAQREAFLGLEWAELDRQLLAYVQSLR